MDEQHPVQTRTRSPQKRSKVGTEVTLRAYEVYKKMLGEQKALITGDCRGGFSTGELIAFLYARSFPEEQWQRRVAEAYKKMENL